jgi:hypothetical protein
MNNSIEYSHVNFNFNNKITEIGIFTYKYEFNIQMRNKNIEKS